VSVSDHIFFTSGGRPRLLLRQFAQLAILVGGGVGAGWSAEEFDALGLAMPKFRSRIDRLAEVLAVARSLWADGTATYDGDHAVTRDLPMSPVPDRPPRLLVGGGSDRLLGLAGRFADLLDLHGDPKHGRVAGATMAQASAGDVARRAHTAVDDLAGRIGLVRDAAEAAGRPRDAVGVATQIWYVAFGSPAEVRAAEEELCERWAGIPYRPLHRSPYLLFGSPAQMAEALAERREAYGLQRISLSEESGIAAAPPDPLRFCREVLPLELTRELSRFWRV
jgi:alkanesulfonate monooxygenase SsuD/methylene tetrahydromethanopterin reductase-like flavin-dependent oxidoreductase (luciferase family)